jgi:peptidoglycan L-alanyl-D-glutamate endopeptidase CwlK
MPSFGQESTENLVQCDQQLQDVLNEAIKYIDFSVICGHRDEEAQNRAYNTHRSLLKWPKSKHNTYPSRAVDVIPYPGGFSNDNETFYLLATYILRAASILGVHLTWGGHWRSLKDLPHFELSKEA